MKLAKHFILFIGLTFTFACNNAPKEKVEEVASTQDVVSSQNLQDTISKAKFDAWTGLWDSIGSGYSDTALVRYYSFPMVDISEFLAVSPAKAFFYQGLEVLSPGHYKAHLILTGDDAQGNSINIYYDVSNPCPPVCLK